MKTKYLVYKTEDNGLRSLVSVSGAEWYEIVNANKRLPSDKKRWFIRDVITDGSESDVLVIEVTHSQYRQWRAEEQRRRRNLLYRHAFKQISIDADSWDKLSALESIPSAPGAEEEYFAAGLLEDLFISSGQWRPWAPALLMYCLSGNSWRSATAWLSEYLGVGIRTARKNKVEFEEFIKNFLA